MTHVLHKRSEIRKSMQLIPPIKKLFLQYLVRIIMHVKSTYKSGNYLGELMCVIKSKKQDSET